MRRAMMCIDDELIEVKLRNISAAGALVECVIPVAPDVAVVIDMIGIGPVRGTVRWAQSGKFGIQFSDSFDLARLAPKKERREEFTMLRPWYVDQREAG